MSINSRAMTLPINSQERKNFPVMSGCLNYFPAALSGVAKISKQGNDKHNPGEPLHHARNKSTDHGDCIIRHLIDVQDLLAAFERSAQVPSSHPRLLEEVSSLAWRALALSQEVHERFGAPLAPGAIDTSYEFEANKVADKIIDALESGKTVTINSPKLQDNEFGENVRRYTPQEQS